METADIFLVSVCTITKKEKEKNEGLGGYNVTIVPVK